MKVYVAGPLASWRSSERMARVLEGRAFRVVSSWHGAMAREHARAAELAEPLDLRDPLEDEERLRLARVCACEVASAEAIVLVLPSFATPRGTLWEAGCFYGAALADARKRSRDGLPRIVWAMESGLEPPTLFDSLGSRVVGAYYGLAERAADALEALG